MGFQLVSRNQHEDDTIIRTTSQCFTDNPLIDDIAMESTPDVSKVVLLLVLALISPNMRMIVRAIKAVNMSHYTGGSYLMTITGHTEGLELMLMPSTMPLVCS